MIACESISLDTLSLYDRRYIVDHCVSAINRRLEERAYRTYITNTLYNINTILATKYGGSSMNYRFAEIMYPEKEKEQSGEDIKNRIDQKLKKAREGG